MSHYQALYHIIIRTKANERTLPLEHCDELYRYMWGIIKNKQCHLYRINGVEDHIHLFIGLHPTIAISDLLRDLKTSAHRWIKESTLFPLFRSWSDGYAAITYSTADKDKIINYIKGQREHHKRVSWREEYLEFLHSNGISYDERFF